MMVAISVGSAGSGSREIFTVASKNRFATKAVKWYRLGPVFSRNAAINIILGPRGDGKTFAAKEQAIRNAINKGEQFVYLRRYKTEMTSRGSFFDDIRFMFPDYGFAVRGMDAVMQRPGEKKWEVIGYFVPLSQSQQKKSVPYPKVTLIIFDEFLIDKGAVHYLPNEVKAFLEFYSTVDRYQDKTRALLISNTVMIANPYFFEWGIRPSQIEEWWTDPDGFVCVHFIKDHEFAAEVRQTRLGKFIDKTDYGAYAMDSVFLDNTDSLVKKKPSSAKYKMTIETETGTFSWWSDSDSGIFFLQEKRPRADEVIYTMLPNKMDENKIYLQPNNGLLGMLRTAFAHGRLFFDGPQARNAFIGVIVR